jgi:hypothetical protein
MRNITTEHIDEYDDSESENETEETSSSQLSHVLVGNGDHESPAELSFLTTRNSPRSGRTLRVSSRLLDYIWSLLHVLKYNNQFFLLLTLFFIFDHNSDTLKKHCQWLENRKYRHRKGNNSPETMTRPR